ncbi:MAG TPA: SOS response-associated peptidase [Longimicrobiales bacterium]|nr:SOS response-associated peptidase [Longimicrobiales bacterium]
MCGRFSLGVDTDALVAEFGTGAAAEHTPRFNIAPTQPVAAVVRGRDGLRFGSLRWGLVPAGPAPLPRAPLINARAETVARLPSFAASFHRRRCWVLADGFYEWRREPDGSRTPFHIRLADGRPFAFAGIWDRTEGPAGALPSCAILTTRAAPALAGIHDRMPVILPAPERDRWIDPTASPGDLEPLLRPYDGPLALTRVSTRVNSVAHDDPSCLEPFHAPPETSRS